MGTTALAVVPLSGELSDLALSRLGPAQRASLARLGLERFVRWATAGAKSTTIAR